MSTLHFQLLIDADFGNCDCLHFLIQIILRQSYDALRQVL